MKLRHKKTGEIREGRIVGEHLQLWVEALNDWVDYDDIDYLAKYWERYKEPKEYWHIFGTNITKTQEGLDEIYDKRNKEIGNYFETKEEAEKAVEKLKAWRRLEKAGFRFEGYSDMDRSSAGHFDIYAYVDTNNNLIEDAQPRLVKDLDLLFGGEE